MKAHTSWSISERPRRPALAVPGCRLGMHDIPRLGRVVVVLLSGRQDPDFWQTVRDALRKEIPSRSPRYLVFDLRELECIVGSACLGGLVAGAIEMRRLGRSGKTRIVATGELATRLARNVSLCKLEPILGEVHEDLPSALQD